MIGRIPSVIEVLSEQELCRAIFLKPEVGLEITENYGVGGGRFPRHCHLSAKMMVLMPGCVIPFHVHSEKEKLYNLQIGNELKVTIFMSGGFQTAEMNYGDSLFIAAGVPHCVQYLPAHCPEPCLVQVLASSQSPKIEWEAGADDLLQSTSAKLSSMRARATRIV